MLLSAETLNLLAVLLSQVHLSASDPDFEAKAASIGQARRELLAALAEVEVPLDTPSQPSAD